jgi:hypothetical protein
MKWLARAFYIGLFAQWSVSGRDPLVVPVAVVAVLALSSLLQHADDARARRLLGLALAAAGAAGGLGIANLAAGGERGGPLLLAAGAAYLGATLYALGMARWCRARGWRRIGAAWHRAGVWMMVATTLHGIALVTVVAFGHRFNQHPAGSFGDVPAFGRSVPAPALWLAGAAFAAMVVAAFVFSRARSSMDAAMTELGPPTAPTPPLVEPLGPI